MGSAVMDGRTVPTRLDAGARTDGGDTRDDQVEAGCDPGPGEGPPPVGEGGGPTNPPDEAADNPELAEDTGQWRRAMSGCCRGLQCPAVLVVLRSPLTPRGHGTKVRLPSTPGDTEASSCGTTTQGRA